MSQCIPVSLSCFFPKIMQLPVALPPFSKVCVFVRYLNDVENGGETILPKHQQPICNPGSMGGPTSRSCRSSWDPETSSCDHGLKVSGGGFQDKYFNTCLLETLIFFVLRVCWLEQFPGAVENS